MRSSGPIGPGMAVVLVIFLLLQLMTGVCVGKGELIRRSVDSQEYWFTFWIQALIVSLAAGPYAWFMLF